VRTFAATLKAKNYRSLGLLRSLGFAATLPPGVSAVSRASGELVMYKALVVRDASRHVDESQR
jgi:hypothetical protein